MPKRILMFVTMAHHLFAQKRKPVWREVRVHKITQQKTASDGGQRNLFRKLLRMEDREICCDWSNG